MFFPQILIIQLVIICFMVYTFAFSAERDNFGESPRNMSSPQPKPLPSFGATFRGSTLGESWVKNLK